MGVAQALPHKSLVELNGTMAVALSQPPKVAFNGRVKMRSATAFLITLVLASSIGFSGGALAAAGDTYKAKKAACQGRAKTMNFDVHLIKKNRWVNDCIAGRHPA